MMSGSFVLDPSIAGAEMTTTMSSAGVRRPRERDNSSSAAGSPSDYASETSDNSGGASSQSNRRRTACTTKHGHPSMTGGPRSSNCNGGRSVGGGGSTENIMPGQRRPRAVSASTAAGSPPAGASPALSPGPTSTVALQANGSASFGREHPSERQQSASLAGRQIQDAPTPTPSAVSLLPNHHHHPNTLPILHENLDAAYERLSALLDRECAQSPVYGPGLQCHVPRPRLMVRKKRTAAGSIPTDGSSAEGRQPTDEGEVRPRFASTTSTATTTNTNTNTSTTGGDHGQAILRQILLQVRPDEEVEEIHASDAGLVYHHAGLDRSADVVGHLRGLAGEFRESDEVVEIAMSYLDRYLMAKADRTGLFYANHATLLSGANNHNNNTNSSTTRSSSTSTPPSLSSNFRATFSPGWSIVYASLACLQIAIKTHSPHGARLSHRPRSFMAPMYWNCLDTVYGLDGGGCHHPDDPAAAKPRPDLMDRCRISIEDRMVAYLMSVGGNSNVHWRSREIREVFARTEADILHTLEFRLIPTTSWGVARDMIDLVETSVQIERFAYEQFRQRQVAMVAENAMQEEKDKTEVDKDHRLAGPGPGPGPAATTIPPPYPVNIDSSRLTKLTSQQLASALHDNDLLSIPRSILARAAVQNALVQINDESNATNLMAGTPTKAELQVQYEAGCAIVGRLAGALRGACSVPYGEAFDIDWDESTEEEYEQEAMFQVAVQSLGKHLNHVLRREAMDMAAQNENEAAAQTIGRDTKSSPPRVVTGFLHVVTPSAMSGMKNRSTKMNVEKVAKSYGSGSTCTADSALDFASERHHRATKKAKKNGGVARLTTGYSPGYGGSGRVILE